MKITAIGIAALSVLKPATAFTKDVLPMRMAI